MLRNEGAVTSRGSASHRTKRLKLNARVAYARAKLKAQFVAVEKETALPRTLVGKISDAYVQEHGCERARRSVAIVRSKSRSNVRPSLWRMCRRRSTRRLPGEDCQFRSGVGCLPSSKEGRLTDDGVATRLVTRHEPGRSRLGSRAFEAVTEPSLESADKRKPDAHDDGAVQHERATTDLVDKVESREGRGDVKGVLYGRGDKLGAASLQTCALEDVDDVYSAKLLSVQKGSEKDRAAHSTS